MKKFFAILAACTAMTVSFASCGDKDNDKKSSSKSGPDKAASDYANSSYNKKGGKTYYTLIYPDEYIEELKDDDEWEDMIDDYNENVADYLEDYKFTVKDIKKGGELTDDQLLGAAYYFSYRFDIEDIDVKEGYEYKIKMQIVDKDDDDKETYTDKICVVKVGKDWKVIKDTADNLEDYV